MTSSKVIEARILAALADAELTRESLEYRWQRAKYTSSGGTDTAEEIDVQILKVDALILELRENLASGGQPPAASAQPAVDLAAPPVNDVQPAPTPEYASTREAADLLGISARTLEGLRARGEGPACIRIGRRVLYRREDLRRSSK